MTVMTTAELDADYAAFCRQVRMHVGLDLSAYKRNQMERRIRAMASAAGAETLVEFWHGLSRDKEALRIFIDKLTINVSEFFRNPEKFEELRQFVLPELLRARRPLSIWSAGCSYGAEAYTLRILLSQLSPGINHRIWASDIDAGVLERAKRGLFIEDDLKNVPSAVRQRYFTQTPEGPQVNAALRSGVEFARHDLLRDPFPRDVDLILCRNVVIYFSDETKDRLFARFATALRPGGYLLIGSTERIPNFAQLGLTSPRAFFYQKA